MVSARLARHAATVLIWMLLAVGIGILLVVPTAVGLTADAREASRGDPLWSGSADTDASGSLALGASADHAGDGGADGQVSTPAGVGPGEAAVLAADASGALNVDPTSLHVSIDELVEMGGSSLTSVSITSPTSVPDGSGVGDVFVAPQPTAMEAAAAGAAVVTAAGGAGLLFWAKNGLAFGASRFLAAPLFSRIQKDDLLENEGRELLLSLVCANPGIGLKELSDGSGLGWGTTVYHLGRLEQAGLLTSMKNGQNRHFFKNGHPAAKDKKAIAVLKNEAAANVARFLMATPGATQTTIAKGLGMGAPTVTKYVKRLSAEGLVEVLPAGRSKIVQPTGALASAMTFVDAPASELARAPVTNDVAATVA